MNSNLKWKAVFVFGVVFLCVFGLFGLPTLPTSVAQLRDNFYSSASSSGWTRRAARI